MKKVFAFIVVLAAGLGISASVIALSPLDMYPKAQRVTLPTNTLYVRTDGSDANVCSANTPQAACRTIQRAVNIILQDVDARGGYVTIQLGNTGTYDGAISVYSPVVGGRGIIIKGDATQPENYIVTSTNAANGTIFAINGADIFVEGIKVEALGASGVRVCLRANDGGNISVTGYIDFGRCETAHMSTGGGALGLGSGYRISGSAARHALVSTGAYLGTGGGFTVDIVGNPHFSNAFIEAARSGAVHWRNTTFNGSATGVKFVVSRGGAIDVDSNGIDFFPGDRPGKVLSGFYNDFSATTLPK